MMDEDGPNGAVRGMIKIKLARWLLITQDRDGGQALSVTLDALAAALCACRVGVTGALHALKGMRLLKSTRGAVAITYLDGGMH
jgi:hypothetical protein